MGKLENIVVYGSGLMGRGIAQVAATYGCKVALIDLTHDVLNKAQSGIRKSLERIATKRYTNDKAKSDAFVGGTLSRIKCLTPQENKGFLEDSDLVIEAVMEDLSVKQKLFKSIENTVKSSAILVTNTSSLSVKDICRDLNVKDRFAGLHFFNPVPLMKLVEVIKTDQTKPQVIEKLIEFAKSLEKVPVLCKDTPGFIVNRLLVPYLMQAVKLHEAGIASKEDIDVAVKLGLGYPMGPFELLDYVGLDTVKSIVDSWNQADIKVPQSIEELVKQGKYGHKSGEGFFIHKS